MHLEGFASDGTQIIVIDNKFPPAATAGVRNLIKLHTGRTTLSRSGLELIPLFPCHPELSPVPRIGPSYTSLELSHASHLTTSTIWKCNLLR